uniref:Integrase catalytic domain-containing protein n=1 Tax=Cannabis sativa TaxID=3483 RepID=A0A803P5E7_CANSA
MIAGSQLAKERPHIQTQSFQEDLSSRLFLAYHEEGCIEYVHKCKQCQRYSKVPRALPMEITLKSSLGIDLVGSLPTGKGGVKFAIVAVDYFTKWVEAEPMNIVTSKKALYFIIENIVCRYKLPHKIVSNYGKQFDSDPFTEFCTKHGTIKSFSIVARPQAN